MGYRGIGALLQIRESGLFRPNVRAVVFVLLGYSFLRSFGRITEIGRAVDGMLAAGHSEGLKGFEI